MFSHYIFNVILQYVFMLYFCNISWYKKYAVYYTIFLLLLAPFI